MGIPLLAVAGKVLGALGKTKAAAKVASASKSISEHRASLSDSGSSSASMPSAGSAQLHPMAQKAMSLDMGFYGHMDASKIKKVDIKGRVK